VHYDVQRPNHVPPTLANQARLTAPGTRALASGLNRAFALAVGLAFVFSLSQPGLTAQASAVVPAKTVTQTKKTALNKSNPSAAKATKPVRDAPQATVASGAIHAKSTTLTTTSKPSVALPSVAAAPVVTPLATAQPQMPRITRLVINAPARRLFVFHDNILLAQFPVGVGKKAFLTPEGDFSVIRKVAQPLWENPYEGKGKTRMGIGADNPLGTCWIGFYSYTKANGESGEFGLHGTPNDRSVGTLASHGCVRMHIPDAEKVFGWVQYGTLVQVTYAPYVHYLSGSKVQLRTFIDPFGKVKPNASALTAQLQKTYGISAIRTDLVQQALTQPTNMAITVAKVSSSPSVPDSTGEAATSAKLTDLAPSTSQQTTTETTPVLADQSVTATTPPAVASQTSLPATEVPVDQSNAAATADKVN
jgi:lipoprotein-anchoring transpeptidase ErfK/SrfK